MCDVYEITSIVAGQTKKEIKTYPCDSHPQDVTKCPKYKFHAAGSSRKKPGPLPNWAAKDGGSSEIGRKVSGNLYGQICVLTLGCKQ